MIESFADEATRDIFDRTNSPAARRALPNTAWKTASRKLDVLNAATELKDLNTPGNHLEKLQGDLKGRYSIRINKQFRIVFKFANGKANDVQIEDYH
jgi:proteic killer suppression protein